MALDHLALLRAELDGFGRCLDADLSTPVPHCGAWTLYDLADHLGRGNLWVVTAVADGRNAIPDEPAPTDPAALRTWFRDTSVALLHALDVDPATPAWTFTRQRTVGFWQRRRALETLVHRWDAGHATGVEAHLDPELAADGVAEVFDTFAPRQIRHGRMAAPAHAVDLRATDTGSSWRFGPGEPVGVVTGTAGQLLLMLWGRVTPADPSIGWDGDRLAARSLLAGPLVP